MSDLFAAPPRQRGGAGEGIPGSGRHIDLDRESPGTAWAMERAGVREAADRADPRALEGFVRALVGVRHAAVEIGRDGRVSTLWVVPAPGVPERQVRLNVLSALMAGPGLALEPRALRFTPSLPEPAARTAAPDPPPSAEPRPQDQPHPGDSHSPAEAKSAPTPDQGPAAPREAPVPEASGDAGPAAFPSSGTLPPALRLVRFEIEHPSPGRIRVVVGVLAGEDRPGLGVREGDERPGAAMELAARAATDAARGTGTVGAAFQLAGVSLAEVAGRTHVVAAVDVWTGGDFAARPGAAAVLASWEEAAARAVLAALCRY